MTLMPETKAVPEWPAAYRSVAKLVCTVFLTIAAALPGRLSALELTGADLLRFKYFLNETFDGRTKGFAYTLVKGQETLTDGAIGWAQDPSDGNVRMTSAIPSNVGSVSKLITGTALLHLLRERPIASGTVNQQLEEPLLRFLPRDWQQQYDDGLEDITLRHLLQHKTGLPKEGDEEDGYKALHWALKEGAQIPPGDVRDYNNNNISVMRFVIPRIFYPNETAFLDDQHAGKPPKEYWRALLPQYNALFKEYMFARFFPVVFSGAHPVCNPYDEIGRGLS